MSINNFLYTFHFMNLKSSAQRLLPSSRFCSNAFKQAVGLRLQIKLPGLLKKYKQQRR